MEPLSADDQTERQPSLGVVVSEGSPQSATAGLRRVITTTFATANAAVIVGAMVVTGLIRTYTKGTPTVPAVIWMAVASVLWFLLVVERSSTLFNPARSPRHVRYRLAIATLSLCGSLSILRELMHSDDIPQRTFALAMAIGLIGLLVVNLLCDRVIRGLRVSGVLKTTVIAVGSVADALELARAFSANPDSEYLLVGICSPQEDWPASQSVVAEGQRVHVYGPWRSIEEVAREVNAGLIVLTPSANLDGATMRRLTWDLEGAGASVALAPDVSAVAPFRFHIQQVGHRPLVFTEPPRHARSLRLGKAVFDRAFAMFAVVALAPVMAAIAVAIKLSSRGPVFYRSERIGLAGEPFRMIKFRSMIDGAEMLADGMIAESGSSALVWKLKDDPRVSRVGRFLRKFSLDELPQFFNVLGGSMSVVGPRPQVQREVDLYDDAMQRRLLVKPGCTGLWQVSGRNDLDFEEAMKLDLYYVDNWSMHSDLWIILRTVKVIASGGGAY